MVSSVLYAPAHGLDATAFADVDGDARFDLRTRGIYASYTYMSGVPAKVHVFVDALFLAHAQPDGSFSLADAVARADFEKRCAGRPRTLAPDAAAEDLGLQIVCERAWGTSAADVQRELRARCTAFVDSPENVGDCPNALLEVASQTPPVSLR